jgi:hypothetical protein
VGLVGFFLIHIKAALGFKILPRSAIAGDGIEDVERRCRGWTWVHSLAMIACSSKVDGANTGILTSFQLPMEVRLGGLDELEIGVAGSQTLRRSIESHSIMIDRCPTLFRQCLT